MADECLPQSAQILKIERIEINTGRQQTFVNSQLQSIVRQDAVSKYYVVPTISTSTVYSKKDVVYQSPIELLAFCAKAETSGGDANCNDRHRVF